MEKVLVAVFDTETAAFEGLSALQQLHEQGELTVYATTVLAKDAAGVVTIKKQADEGPLGTALGMMTGGLVGLLAGPVGLAMGATAGAMTGLMFDVGKVWISSDVVDQISLSLQPGKAAVLAEVDETWVTPVDTRLGALGATVIRRPTSEAVQEQVNRDAAAYAADMKQLEQELAQARAEDKAAVQKEIAAIRKQLEATRAEIDAEVERSNREANAKLNALSAQMQQASDRRKAQIEKRMAKVKADHAARSAKLEQARKLTRDALLP